MEPFGKNYILVILIWQGNFEVGRIKNIFIFKNATGMCDTEGRKRHLITITINKLLLVLPLTVPD